MPNHFSKAFSEPGQAVAEIGGRRTDVYSPGWKGEEGLCFENTDKPVDVEIYKAQRALKHL